MPAQSVSIKASALRWLAQREHSRSEMRSKLLRLLLRRAALLRSASRSGSRSGSRSTSAGAAPANAANGSADDNAEVRDPAAEVELLLQWLESDGHLSQARFIESRVHARQARFGNLRIRQELKQHGLSLDETARQALQQTELQRAQAVWDKKFKLPAPDARARLRQMRFLVGRGFSPDVVRQVLRGVDGHDETGD